MGLRTASLRHGLPSCTGGPRPATCPTKHEQHQRSARQREQSQLKELVASLSEPRAPAGRVEKTAATVEGWSNFPRFPVGPSLEHREVGFRKEASMRQANEQLSMKWKSQHAQPQDSLPSRPKSADRPVSRFTKLFDPKHLPSDFREQLYNLQRRAFNFNFRPTLVSDAEMQDQDLGEESVVYETPQTPPNSPSNVEPSASRTSCKKRTLTEKSESLRSSPSMLRQMRIPSLTSEISDASGENEIRRFSTVTLTQQEDVLCIGEDSSSSAVADLEMVPTSAGDDGDDGDDMDYEILQRAPRVATMTPMTPKTHWLEMQESRISQHLRRGGFVCWSETMTPRQAGGVVTRNWLKRNKKTPVGPH